MRSAQIRSQRLWSFPCRVICFVIVWQREEKSVSCSHNFSDIVFSGFFWAVAIAAQCFISQRNGRWCLDSSTGGHGTFRSRLCHNWTKTNSNDNNNNERIDPMSDGISVREIPKSDTMGRTLVVVNIWAPRLLEAGRSGLQDMRIRLAYAV